MTVAAGVSVAIEKVNLTISEVDAQLTLNVKLDRVATLVNRTLQTLDLNPNIERIGQSGKLTHNKHTIYDMKSCQYEY